MGVTQLSHKFKWLQMVHILLKELNETRDKIYDMNYIEALNWLAYFKENNEVAKNNT